MNPQFKRCKKCGTLFQSRLGSRDYCDACTKAMDEKFVIVRDYLYDYPNATVRQVVEDTGIEEEIIESLVGDGRLQMRSSDGLLHCEKCGRVIQSGRLCPKCQDTVNALIKKGAEIAQKNKAIKENRGFKSNVKTGE